MRDVEHVPLAPVIRLRPIRTLVVSRDLAFRQRAVTVLGDLGVAAFAVVSLEMADEVVELITRERPDVVMLDATGCEPAVARVVYQLSSVAPRIGVVLVATRGDRVHRLATLDKWGWAEELSRAVQDAYRRGNPLTEEEPTDVQQPG
jgi:DNA-binding NtrC family response regulator